MEIVLARHGQPDLHAWPRIPAWQMKAWIEHYDASGLVAARPPMETVVAARGARLIVSSTMRRAVESVEALGLACRHLREPLFREAGLPHAMWRFPTLAPAVWAASFRLCWALGYSGGGESVRQARMRARLGAARLIALAQESGSVLLLGHGIMNQLIATELLRSGWQGPKRPARGHWNTSRYSKPA